VLSPVLNPLREQYEAAVSRDALPFEAESLRRRYAYAVPTPEAIAQLILHTPLIELGAGLGYWAELASRAGADVLAYDAAAAGVNDYTQGPAHHDVRRGGAEQLAMHPERTLFLCWPPRAHSMAFDALTAYRGARLIYAGPLGEHERNAGDAAFHGALSEEWSVERTCTLPPWPERELAGDLRIYVRR